MAKKYRLYFTALILSLTWSLALNACKKESSYTWHCSQLNHFPGGDYKMKILIYTNNTCIDVKKQYFNKDFLSLEQLVMTNNNIASIEDEAFSKLNNLEVLDLTNNRLVTLKDKTFSNLTALKELKLIRNLIKEINEAVFSDLASLEYLDLSYNSISYIPVNLIENNKKLIKFDVSNNQLQLLNSGPIINSVSLEILYMTNCSVSFLPQEAFTKIPALLELIISNNGIEKLEPKLFTSNKNLEYLDITHNKLSDEKKICSVLSNLTKVPDIEFEENPLTIKGQEDVMKIMQTPCAEITGVNTESTSISSITANPKENVSPSSRGGKWTVIISVTGLVLMWALP